MNCPACLSIMINRDEIHKISPTKNRMNLHCKNHSCLARNIYIAGSNEKFIYSPFVQVITNDPYPWESVGYGLIFLKNKKIILLEGSFTCDFTIVKFIKGFDTPNMFDTNINWVGIKKTKFQQLSTDNDMHIHATKLMVKLTKLLPFI